MDPEQNMYGVEVTESNIPDILMMNSLIFDDGGYYSIDGVEGLNKQGITPVIPPPCLRWFMGNRTHLPMIK
jgi:hypothetical protein